MEETLPYGMKVRTSSSSRSVQSVCDRLQSRNPSPIIPCIFFCETKPNQTRPNQIKSNQSNNSDRVAAHNLGLLAKEVETELVTKDLLELFTGEIKWDET